MASINNTPTTNAGTLVINELVTRLVLGAVSIDRGLVNIRPNAQDIVEIPTFRVANDLLQAYAETPTLPGNDGLTKGKVVFPTSKVQWFTSYNPILNFEADWSSFWHTGSLNEAQLNAKIRSAVVSETQKSVSNGVEKLLWQGDKLSGDAWLAMIDGYELLLENSTTINEVTDLTVAIDKTNILAMMQGLIDVTPDAVLELGSSKFVMPHSMKQIYFEASRDIAISKGINIFESGTPRFAGYEIISNGQSANKCIFADCNGGPTSVLQGATWMNNDMTSAKIERTQTFSDLWGVLYTFRLGCALINEDQISYYNGTVA